MRRFDPRFTKGLLAGMTLSIVVGITTVGVASMGDSRYQSLSLFSDVFRLVRDYYVEPVDDTSLVQGAVRGMLASLDPHSSYLDPKSHREMQIDTRGEFFGLGIEIMKERDGFVDVVSPIDGTPAARAGLKARDKITRICPTTVPDGWEEPCRSTEGLDLHEAVTLMRGPKGSSITVFIMRDGFEAPQSFEIVRDVVKVASVTSDLLEGGYGYFRVRSFQERTTQDLRRAIEKRLKQNSLAFAGAVIDLRDNPGGLFDQAVGVADLWLEDGLIVYTEGRSETQRQEFRAKPSGEGHYPLVVLVNEGSASASEIVAGALQDQKRALVVGVSTFGKGSVQTVYPLDDGSGLRLTTALYYTPDGRSIQEVGIQPDIHVEAVVPEHLAESGPIRLREKDLDGHFRQPEGRSESTAGQQDTDIQLARAVEVLKSWTYFERLRKEPKETSDSVQAAEAH